MKSRNGNEWAIHSSSPAPAGASNSPTSVVIGMLLIGALLASGTRACADPDREAGKREISTMTVNLYIGGGTGRVLALDPTDPGYVTTLITTVTGIYYEILASQPTVRLQGVADEVAARRPDLLAVQEASLIRNASPGDIVLGGTQPATNVVFDYLQILVDALAARGAHYAVVATAAEIDVELPMVNMLTGSFDDVRLTDREAILVRTDLPPGQLRTQHSRSGNFANVIPIPALGRSVLRGWCSVDVSLRGQDFRFICTHLEEETVPQLQMLQAQELLGGPAHVKMPVLIAGDFNADPLQRNGTQTYDALIAAGFTDAWAARHPGNLAGGLTWGHDEFLADPTTAMIWRIDLMLFRGGDFVPAQVDTSDLSLDRTQPPFWASDHAAVAADFHFRHGRQGHHE